MRRIFGRDGRALVVPLDHGVSDGPFGDVAGFVGIAASHGADAVVVHKGTLRRCDPAQLRELGVIVHLSASSSLSRDPNGKVLVTGVEEAAALGADGVSVHVNVGSESEAQQLRDLGSAARGAEGCGLPLLAMMYPRGGTADESSANVLAHIAFIAAELGADLVKLPCAPSPDAMAEVTDSCPIPVLVAGGPARADVFEIARDVMRNGACGLAVGRNIFRSHDPGYVIRRLFDVVHGRQDMVHALDGAAVGCGADGRSS
jgi:predicted phospho-2-dehydro-3-deoxyheptonate aldolase